MGSLVQMHCNLSTITVTNVLHCTVDHVSIVCGHCILNGLWKKFESALNFFSCHIRLKFVFWL